MHNETTGNGFIAVGYAYIVKHMSVWDESMILSMRFLTSQLEEGSAEVFGTELEKGVRVDISQQKLAVSEDWV